MKSIARTIRPTQKYLLRQFYSASSDRSAGKMSSVQPVDIQTQDEIDFEVEEIRIRMPWSDGVMAGKWWGSKHQRPIVCLHGWQDNAGTFDRIIPLLPKTESYLALDLPGHGLSSRVPHGIQYHGVDNLYMLSHLCQEYKWDKISLMGHSMGSILAFMFACVFPEKVDMLIQIDALKPQVPNPERVAKGIKDHVENFMLADKRNQEKSEPPAYTYDEMIDKVEAGTFGSVTKDTAEYLLKRNIRRSEKYPGKYYFTRDSRLKHSFSPSISQPVTLELSKKMRMPHVFFKATNSPYWERKEYFDEVIDILKENPKFEFHTVESTHHVHLTEPEKIAPIISTFIEKYSKSKLSKL